MKILFVGGTGKCGTTFTKELLGLHPHIYAINRETNPLYDTFWDKTNALSIRKAYDEGAKVLLEKTPSNALCARWLLAKWPDSHYLHVDIGNDERQAEKMANHNKFTVPRWNKIGGMDEARAYVAFVHQRYLTVKKYVPHRVRHLRMTSLLESYQPIAELLGWLGLHPFVPPAMMDKLDTVDAKRLLGDHVVADPSFGRGDRTSGVRNEQ